MMIVKMMIIIDGDGDGDDNDDDSGIFRKVIGREACQDTSN